MLTRIGHTTVARGSTGVLMIRRFNKYVDLGVNYDSYQIQMLAWGLSHASHLALLLGPSHPGLL